MSRRTFSVTTCLLVVLLVISTFGFTATTAHANPCDAGWTYEAGTGTCFRLFTANESWTPPTGVTSIDYLVVGGGGGGAGGNSSGANTNGGNGGTVITGTSASFTPNATLTITVGAGGSSTGQGTATAGQSSSITGGGLNLTAAGGAGAGRAGAGANGTTSSFSGSSVIYGSSGGGTNNNGGSGAGNGSATNSMAPGTSAVANRGGGGGAGSPYQMCLPTCFNSATGGGSGGSGVVMIRYVGFGVSSFSTSTGALSNSTSLTYSLSFSANIDASTLTSSDLSNSGTATGCVFAVTPNSGAASTFSITVTGCSDGTVIPTLASGSITTSAGASGPGATAQANSVTIDTTPPNSPSGVDLLTGSDTGSSSTDNTTNDTTPTMSATGGNNGDTMTISATNGTTTVSCTYIIGSATNCTLPTLTDGTWNISSTLTDQANNTSAPSPVLPITIDTTAPSAPSGVDLLAGSDTGSSSTDNTTNDTTPTMSATGGNNGDTMTISATNGSTTVSCTYVIGVATECTLPTLTPGNWNISSTLTDPSGNTSPSSNALPITIDTTPPSAPSGVDLLAGSDTGSSSTDNTTNDTTPTMSATGGNNGDTMTISATNGGITLSCTYTIGSATNCTLPTLTDGTWNVSSTLTDPSGNTSSTSSALPITIDGTPPTSPTALDLLSASDTGSSSSDNFTGDNTPTLGATGGSNGDTMTISATNGGITLSCTYTIGSATNCTLPTLTDGTWDISATLSDSLGNTSSASPVLPVTIATSAPTRTAPDLLPTSDTGRSSSDYITSDTTPEISIPGGVIGDVVTLSATNGTSTVSCTYTVGAASSCTLPTLTDGTWTISASITDAAGNTGPASGNLTLTVDSTAPSAPSDTDLLATSDSGTSDSDNNTSDTTPTFSASGGANGDLVTITATKGTETKTCTYIIGTASSCDLPTLTDGTWTVSASVTDAAGNTSPSSSPLSFVIDSKTSGANANGSVIGGLPTSTPTETSRIVTPGLNSLTGRITFTPNAGATGASHVVFTVINKSGKIVSRITRAVKPSDKTASITVKNDGSLSTIRIHTINNTGVSESALRGSNVKRGKTSSGRLTDGRPSLIGDLLAEVMYFRPNSAVLTPRTIQLLNKVARSINAKGGNLYVSGFARKNGIDTPKYLRNLSLQRAEAVAQYLSRQGVRLWTLFQGFGAVTQEIGTPAERRVEVRWVSK